MTFTRKFLLATLCLPGLVACGGSSSSSDDESETSTDTTITVMDGYLTAAQVYIDSNQDGVADSDEYIGDTDENGEIVITEAQSAYAIIANVVAGEAFDADRVGVVTRSYTLAAEAGNVVVTPYTTLAFHSDYTLTDIANELDLNSNNLSGNYISLKSTSSRKNSSTKIHAVARGLADDMAIYGSDYDTDALMTLLKTQITAVESYINTYGYDAVDLVTPRIIDDSVTIVNNYTTLSDYLGAGETWYVNHTNSAVQASDGETALTFDVENKQFEVYDQNDTYTETRDYLIDDTSLVSTGSQTDTFMALMPSIALNFDTLSGELEIWSESSIDYPFEAQLLTSTAFSGQTWYMLVDSSSTSTPSLLNVTLDFSELSDSPTGTVTATDDDGTVEGSYYVTTITHDDLGVVAPLYLQFDSGLDSLALTKVTSMEDIEIYYDLNASKYVIFTTNPDLAAYLADTING